MDLGTGFEGFRSAAEAALAGWGQQLASGLPRVLGALLVLLIGWWIAWGVGALVERALQRLGFERAAGALQLPETLRRAGFQTTASHALGRTVHVLTVALALLIALRTLEVASLNATLDRVLMVVPNLFAAAMIIVVGIWLARLFGAFVASGSAAAGIAQARRLGFISTLLSAGLAVLLAVEQLGLAVEVLVLPIAILAGVGGLGVAATFALGAYPIVTHILAGHFLRQSLPRDRFVEVEGQRGIVERIGAIDTVFRNDERSWSVPNSRLLNLDIGR